MNDFPLWDGKKLPRRWSSKNEKKKPEEIILFKQDPTSGILENKTGKLGRRKKNEKKYRKKKEVSFRPGVYLRLIWGFVSCLATFIACKMHWNNSDWGRKSMDFEMESLF